MNTVLIVEDDPSILRGLRDAFRKEGYIVVTAMDGEEGLARACAKEPDLIILDIMLPKIDGFEVLRLLRSRSIDTPVIALTAKTDEPDRIVGLDLGADDYVTKPFSIRELLARARAVLRRKTAPIQETQTCRFADVEVDFASYVLRKKGKVQEVSAKELELLKLLVSNPGRVLDRQTILNRVWGADYYGTPRTVDNFITKLRQKIEDDPENPKLITTVWRVGYKFEGELKE